MSNATEPQFKFKMFFGHYTGHEHRLGDFLTVEVKIPIGLFDHILIRILHQYKDCGYKFITFSVIGDENKQDPSSDKRVSIIFEKI